jgi:Carboxypeptidase regulatory-like domain
MGSRKMRRPAAASALLIALAACAPAALAGAVVEFATVPSTGHPQSVSTDAAGAFRIPGLAPGRYRIHVAQPGFAVFEREVTVGDGCSRSSTPI